MREFFDEFKNQFIFMVDNKETRNHMNNYIKNYIIDLVNLNRIDKEFGEELYDFLTKNVSIECRSINIEEEKNE